MPNCCNCSYGKNIYAEGDNNDFLSDGNIEMNGLGAEMVNAMVKGVTVTIEGEVGWNGKNIQQQRTQQAMLWRVVMMVKPALYCYC